MTFIGNNQGTNTGNSQGNNTGRVPGYKQTTLQSFTPEQMNLFKQMFSHVGPDSQTARLASGDQSAFGEIERPALQQFAGLQGNLASRFSGLGTGARRSSGFGLAAGQQAQDFAAQLASQRQGIQRQALQDLFGLSNQLLSQKPFESYFTPRQETFGQALGQIGLQGLGAAAGSFGGPIGSALGQQAGQFLGKKFFGNNQGGF
jgi:hypothetical protein